MGAKPAPQERPKPFHGIHMDFTKAVAIFISGVLASSMVHTLMIVSPRTALVQLNGNIFLFYNKSLGDLNVEKFTHKHPRRVDGVNDVWRAYPHSSRNLHDIGIARKLDWRL